MQRLVEKITTPRLFRPPALHYVVLILFHCDDVDVADTITSIN